MPILPAPDLEWMTALLADPRVACVLVGDLVTAGQVTSTVAKLLDARSVRRREGAALGRARLLDAGQRLPARRRPAIAAIGDFAAGDGRAPQVPRADRSVHRRDADERALRRARRLRRQAAVRRRCRSSERVLVRADEKAVVQYGCDGERFAVSVRDPSARCARRPSSTTSTSACTRPEQIDRKARRRRPRAVPRVQLRPRRSASTSSPARPPRSSAASTWPRSARSCVRSASSTSS